MTTMTRALELELRAILDEADGTIPTAAKAEPEVMRVLGQLDDSLTSSQRELAAHHKALVALRSTSKRAEDLQAVLLIVKEAHAILGDIRTTIREEFRT